ncbi:Multidrug resistance protein MdtA precursor [Thalassoglobus neptunius]|uniref:Multidrug resistance protein MdtA n=1 Tax=Thalassoglobus neptunius TaxID=1938619 RepID=A0A5C5VW14_9PLAN|nr:efflux RND transporter periplasmic adaptor subunit [Thalassoglobus neptunius]TWT42798.1 Multidrug resistance protein MdtA precursor [Thalassoglobus neptunius]
MNEVATIRPKRLWARVLITGFICLAILGASAAAIVIINQTEPTAQQIEATRKSAALVQTVTVKRGDYSPRLDVLGTVRPAQSIVLSPRVSGQVTYVAPSFLPGGMVQQGDELVRIDRVDFLNALSINESELLQAKAELEIEQGRQTLAKKELALLEGTIGEANRALVLREPQIASIEAQVSAAEAAVERARLNLERTSIVAPFDAYIVDCSVNVGSQVATGDELAQLVGVEEYWIFASVPIRSLQWVQFPETDGEGSRVLIRNRDSWLPGTSRTGTVSRLIGTLDQQTRLARVLITVPDPLALKTDGPPLILETLIETQIQCRPINDVVRLRRDYVHEGDTVWVMKNDKLEI